MRRLLCALAFVCSAWAQTATISGQINDPATTGQSVNTYLQFELKGCAGNQPRYNGVALLWPVVKKYTASSLGAISGTIYRNDYITCGSSTDSNFWAMTVVQNGQPSPPCNVRITTSTFNANQPSCLNSNPVVTVADGDTTYIRINGTNTLSILPTTDFVIGTINNVRYANAFASIQAAIDDLPGSGGVVFIPCGTYTSSSTITVPSQVYLVGAGVQCTLLNYSGAGTAIDFSGISAGLARMSVRATATSYAGTIILADNAELLFDEVDARCTGTTPAANSKGFRVTASAGSYVTLRRSSSFLCDYPLLLDGTAPNEVLVEGGRYDGRTAGSGVQVQTGDNIRFVGVTFEGGATSLVTIDAATNVFIAGSRFEGTVTNGLVLTVNSSDVTILGNLFDGMTNPLVNNGCTRCTIFGSNSVFPMPHYRFTSSNAGTATAPTFADATTTIGYFQRNGTVRLGVISSDAGQSILEMGGVSDTDKSAVIADNNTNEINLRVNNTTRLAVGAASTFTGTLAATSTVQGTQLISTIATGTAPLTVSSTTKVSNLNADQVDGVSILLGSASLDFTALAANSCEVFTVAVTGAVDGDTVAVGVTNALADVDGATERTTFFGWVSAADTVSVRRCNVTGAATADPAAATVKVRVIQ